MVPIESQAHARQTLNIEDVATVLGINRSTAYELARRNELPVPVIRLGRRMVVSRRAVEELLNSALENDQSLSGDAA
jgi:excisionase family DNA binding protein